MAKDLSTLRSYATTIKNETVAGANTASRIGELFLDIIDVLASGGGGDSGTAAQALAMAQNALSTANGAQSTATSAMNKATNNSTEIAALWDAIGGSPSPTPTPTSMTVFYGFGGETLNNPVSLDYYRSQTSAIGTYNMQYGGSGRYLWVVLPASWTFSEFTMGGFELPMESGQSIMVGSTSYTAYRSSNRYDEDVVVKIR